MKGEPFIIVKKILEREDNPVKEQIGEKSAQKIIEVIIDEYEREFVRKIGNTAHSSIYRTGLGAFNTNLSRLKGYTRRLIKDIRSRRNDIKELEKQPGFVKEESNIWAYERELTRKLGVSWQQIEEFRRVIIVRTINHNNKLRAQGRENEIKVNYEQFDYPFARKYVINA